MADCLRVLVVLPKDPSFVASTYIGQLTTIRTSSSRGSNVFLWPLQASTHLVYIYTHINVNKSFFKENRNMLRVFALSKSTPKVIVMDENTPSKTDPVSPH